MTIGRTIIEGRDAIVVGQEICPQFTWESLRPGLAVAKISQDGNLCLFHDGPESDWRAVFEAPLMDAYASEGNQDPVKAMRDLLTGVHAWATAIAKATEPQCPPSPT